MTTDLDGDVTNRRDYTAFGEENLTPQRETELGYTGSTEETRKGYTGYEKDAESGLEFAQARYYKTTHGRYTSVDPLTASVNIRNPQTFNRYSYVLNSPYKYTDPLGLLPRGAHGGCSAENSSCDENGNGVGVDEYANRIYQTEVARLLANQAFARGDTDEGWRIIRESEGSLQALDQNGNAVRDPQEPTVTVEATVNSPGQVFVISNAGAFFDGLESNSGYQDAAGIAQCALLPLGWENDQDSVWGKLWGVSRDRMTKNWFQGDQVTDNMGIVQGTVLASGWVNRAYLSKPSGDPTGGNHVVVFHKFGTDNRGRRGMYVAEQLANKGGRPVYSFKPFDASGGYFGNAGAFHVVRLRKPTQKVDPPNVIRRVLTE